MFKEFGVKRMVEAWGDDVPDGKVTDFKGAVQAKDDEIVVFSWFEYPDSATRDAANEKMMSDPRMKEMGADMPFDGKRMIVGGFDSIVDDGRARRRWAMPTASSFPSPKAIRKPIARWPKRPSKMFQEHGATPRRRGLGRRRARRQGHRLSPRGEGRGRARTSSFPGSNGRTRQTRDEGWAKVMADERMKPDHDNMPFDGKRMFWGGFAAHPRRIEETPDMADNFIWYELMTPDQDAATAFYTEVVGWTAADQQMAELDFRYTHPVGRRARRRRR